MKIIVTGATGFIGRALVEALLERGDQVVALTRGVEKAQEVLGPNVEALEWHAPQPGPWMDAFNGADGVVNLAGEPVGPRPWTQAQKERILASRVDATRAVVEAIKQANPRPSVLVNGSAIGYYGSQGDTVLTEESPNGSDFLAYVVASWERAAMPVTDLGVRLVLIRTGIVLGRGGGALRQMALPFRFFVGGTMGRRGQWVSWIHMDDEVGLIIYALTHDSLSGPVNATAPTPVTMEVFSRQIGQALDRPSWVPMLGTAIELSLGELGRSLLSSQRVLPRVAEASGYRFRHTESGQALRSVLGGS
jgi:uncharacterized protein (TIGR01777 family)